jgi:hypothetical protein
MEEAVKRSWWRGKSYLLPLILVVTLLRFPASAERSFILLGYDESRMHFQ